jgi:hypothetical protein
MVNVIIVNVPFTLADAAAMVEVLGFAIDNCPAGMEDSATVALYRRVRAAMRAEINKVLPPAPQPLTTDH